MLLESSAYLSSKTEKAGLSEAGKYPAPSAASLSIARIWMVSETQTAAAQSATIPLAPFPLSKQMTEVTLESLGFPTQLLNWWVRMVSKQQIETEPFRLKRTSEDYLAQPALQSRVKLSRWVLSISKDSYNLSGQPGCDSILTGIFSPLCQIGISHSDVCLNLLSFCCAASGRVSPIFFTTNP